MDTNFAHEFEKRKKKPCVSVLHFCKSKVIRTHLFQLRTARMPITLIHKYVTKIRSIGLPSFDSEAVQMATAKYRDRKKEIISVLDKRSTVVRHVAVICDPNILYNQDCLTFRKILYRRI